MCGIAGILSADVSKVEMNLLKNMADTLSHRGPDGEGYYINSSGNVGFGHRRLSVIDLSDAGAQPMHYQSRYTIVYNGEIYNYKEIRSELMKQGYQFHSSSDTEVILAAYDSYKEKCLDYFDGMFAFALWDEVEKSLFAARDRFGEKPFYYSSRKNYFVFASEIKALLCTGITKEVDEKMLLNYLALGYVQNATDKSQTFYMGIQSLPASHYLKYNLKTNDISIFQYWNIDKQATSRISIAEAVDNLDSLLNISVSRRLRSDVSVGVSLSGGIDSSSISCYMASLLPDKKIKAFTAKFPGFEKDESMFADLVSKHLNLFDYSVNPTAHNLISEFERMAYHQEEPFPSSSIYAQYKVYELAKKENVTVLLDGQGADEVLAGYPKYLHWYLQEILSRNRFVKLKTEKSGILRNKIKVKWGVKNIVAAYFPSHAAIALEKNEYQKILNNTELTKSMIGTVRGREWEGIYKPIITKLNDILYFNTMQSGLEELLRYCDRNSMSHGVEVRLPFLNKEIVKYIFSLPSDLKISDGYTKWILRQLMKERLPAEIVWRTDKVGYEPPQKQWMNEPVMQDYIHESRKKLVDLRILKPSVIKKKVRDLPAHTANNYDWRYLCASWLLS